MRTLSHEEDCSLQDCWLGNIKELDWCQHLRNHDLVNPLQCGCFRSYVWCFATVKLSTDFQTPTLPSPHFPRSLFKLIGMVGEVCLLSNAYLLWTPDYAPFILGPYHICLSDYSEFSFCVHWLYDFPKYNFGVSDSFAWFCVQFKYPKFSTCQKTVPLESSKQ